MKSTPELHYSICIYYCSTTHRTSNTLTLAEHLRAQRLVKKLEGNRSRGKQTVIDHLIPYPAAVEDTADSVRIRLLDFEDMTITGPCRDSAIRAAQNALLRCILNMMRDSASIPAPDQYLELVEEGQLMMIDPMATEAA